MKSHRDQVLFLCFVSAEAFVSLCRICFVSFKHNDDLSSTVTWDQFISLDCLYRQLLNLRMKHAPYTKLMTCWIPRDAVKWSYFVFGGKKAFFEEIWDLLGNYSLFLGWKVKLTTKHTIIRNAIKWYHVTEKWNWP